MGLRHSKDMAVCLVFFNPARSKRMLMNYMFVKNELRKQNLPCFTIELLFEDRPPEILDAFHVRSRSYMFHKERLCRILETKVPRKYTKLAFLDADILFSDPTWYSRTSALLELYDVVQPFETCEWLDLAYKTVTLRRETVALMKSPKWDWMYHPGFAWAFRRDWYRKVGFFDWAISGSGDTLSAAAWLNKTFPSGFKSLPPSMTAAYDDFKKKPTPRLTYLKGFTVSHLYHGSRANRQYVDRHEALNLQGDLRSLVSLNRDGVYEWKLPAGWNPIFQEYFTKRNDDDVCEEIGCPKTS